MSVTFNRAQLIKVANTALAAHDKAAADYAKACADYRAEHAIRGTRNDKIRELRDYLTARLKKGGPIRRAEVRKAVNNGSDIEELFYSGVDDYVVTRNVTAPAKFLTPAEVTETRALLSVLGAATGDTISANELKLLGLKNLAPVFTAAAQAARA